MSSNPPQEAEDQQFGIGAVVERTGLTAPGIRMWEKRYDAVVPKRTETNRRVYSSEDVARLRLLKLLTDQGDSIRNIARLGLDQLQQRFGEGVYAKSMPPMKKILGMQSRLILIGSGLDGLLQDTDLFEADVVERFNDLSEAAQKKNLGKTDLMVVSTETLFPEMVTALREIVATCEAKCTVLTYRFASSKTATALAKAIDGLVLHKAPISENQLRRECLVQLNAIRSKGDSSQVPDPGPVPEHLYTPDQLTRLSRVTSAIDCECPQHMAGLLQSLSAFEKYSQECEDRNPEDALLHAFLHRTTAQVRRTMEEALRHLVLTEGIELD